MAIEPRVKSAIQEAVTREPFAQALKMELINLALGHSVVEMVYDPVGMNNIYERIHGGAIFALIDEAFETASQTDGTIAVALNVNVSYVCSPEQGARPVMPRSMLLLPAPLGPMTPIDCRSSTRMETPSMALAFP